MELCQIDQVLNGKGRHELVFHELGIFGADAIHDDRADVAEDGRTDGFFIQLFNVLVRDNQVEAVFSGLGKNVGESLGGKVLELIDIKIKILAFFFRCIDAFHGRELDFGNKHAANEFGIVFANAPLGQVHDENLAVIHDAADVDR